MYIWFVTEWKRAVAQLPVLLKRLVIFVIACVVLMGLTVFGTRQIWSGNNTRKTTVRIGYVAPEDMLTKLAVSYVEQLESVKSWCSLEKTTVDKGMALLENGALTALLILPDDLVNEILTGSNAPVTVYLPESVDASVTNSKVFEELANAGVGMLQTAQAEIYAAETLAGEAGVKNLLEEMYYDINRFNLSIALTRESLWENISLSVTGNHTYAVYYGSAFFAVYLLVAALFIGNFCKRNHLQQFMAWRRLGIPFAWQLASQWSALLLLMALVGVLPFCLLLYPPFAELLLVVFTPQMAVAVFFALALSAMYALMVYQYVGEHQRAVLVLGLLALAQGYAAGCIIPSVLLPQGIAAVGAFVPAAYIKAAFTILFTGSTQNFSEVILGLAVWSCVCFVFAWFGIALPERKGLGVKGKDKNVKWQQESIGGLHKRNVNNNNILKNQEMFQDTNRVDIKKINKEEIAEEIKEGEKKAQNLQNARYKSSNTQVVKNIQDDGKTYKTTEASFWMPIFWILFKRLFYQKSLWVCLCLVVILSAAAVHMENSTETSIVAAVYDADGFMEETLTQYQGLVKFVLCSSEEEVKQMVLRDKAECGYILPAQILEQMAQRKADGSIIVYEDGDAVAARVVDEVLFQKLFHCASLQWFEGYIAEKSGSENMENLEISSVVEEQIAKDKTFAIQIERLGEEQIPPAFPARLLVVSGVLLCALQGLAQAGVDWQKKRFYKYNRAVIVLITVVQPVVMGMLAGGTALVVTGWIGGK
ncbi:MAG: ABC transporter permease [Lachnospiraceae bacterium]|nr:ABC transporter permease [Lachnospiraceae bacterium]